MKLWQHAKINVDEPFGFFFQGPVFPVALSNCVVSLGASTDEHAILVLL